MKNSEKIILKMKENNGVITYNYIKKMNGINTMFLGIFHYINL